MPLVANADLRSERRLLWALKLNHAEALARLGV